MEQTDRRTGGQTGGLHAAGRGDRPPGRGADMGVEIQTISPGDGKETKRKSADMKPACVALYSVSAEPGADPQPGAY